VSEKMELIYDGEVQKVGKNTCVVRIPAETAKVLDIGPGSRVLMSKEGRTLVLEFPAEGEKATEAEKPAEF
jgi:antitoxin component of MazEF toxin-antitoxin module